MPKIPIYFIILSIIGVIVIIKYVFLFLKFIIKYILSPCCKNNLKRKYGDGFVIITGGSRGIGFSFAKEFLKAGFKVCLISSNKEKLDKARDELLDLFPFSVIKIIDFNLGQFYTEETINELKQRIDNEFENEDISILFNNAGAFIDEKFDLTPEKGITNLLNVNICGLTILTKIIIEYMKKRLYKSLIIVSGSNDSRLISHNRIVYCSSKLYVQGFYEGLALDFPDKFDFTLIEVGPVKTDMNKKDYPCSCSPDDFASECINLVGRYNYIQGCKKHAFLSGLISIPFVPCLIRYIDQ